MKKELKVLLVGVGGYGAGYARELLDNGHADGASVTGVVDPYAASSSEYDRLTQAGVRFYDTVEDFYRNGTADLAVIATPITFHAAQAVYCMEHGSHVLCEKPAAAVPEDVQAMIDARDRTGRTLAIGFQWCYDEAMLRLKADVNAGLLGRPVRLKAIVLWPRDIAYYQRGSGWAGKKYAKDGAPIFDSVASNATAHYIENMLWLAGDGCLGTDIADMEVRTARANDIETFDTVAFRAALENGASVFYTASHATGKGNTVDPAFVYEFEKATVRFTSRAEGAPLIAEFTDGTVKDYGVSLPNGNGWRMKLRRLYALLRGETDLLPCPAEAALRHTRAMAMIREKAPEAEVFADRTLNEEARMMWVPGLFERLKACYETESLDF